MKLKPFTTVKPVTTVTSSDEQVVTAKNDALQVVNTPTVTTVTTVTSKKVVYREGGNKKEESATDDDISLFPGVPSKGVYFLPVTPVTVVTEAPPTRVKASHPTGNSGRIGGNSGASTGNSATEKRRILYLGHPTDPNFGSVEAMTPAQYTEFVQAHTWPSKGAL